VNQKPIKDLINSVKTDVSGKWVSTQDLEEFATYIVLRSAQLADSESVEPYTSRGELIREFFGVR